MLWKEPVLVMTASVSLFELLVSTMYWFYPNLSTVQVNSTYSNHVSFFFRNFRGDEIVHPARQEASVPVHTVAVLLLLHSQSHHWPHSGVCCSLGGRAGSGAWPASASVSLLG